jgi:hypothetical protein
MEMDDTKLGFSHLRLLRCNNNTLFKMHKQNENGDFTSLLGHEQFDLVIHCLANDIHFLECNVNAKFATPSLFDKHGQ